jgi:hypothetical protein
LDGARQPDAGTGSAIIAVARTGTRSNQSALKAIPPGTTIKTLRGVAGIDTARFPSQNRQSTGRRGLRSVESLGNQRYQDPNRLHFE